MLVLRAQHLIARLNLVSWHLFDEKLFRRVNRRKNNSIKFDVQNISSLCR